MAQQKQITVLADERSKELKVFCPLCHDVFVDPYITSCGHTFCQHCVADGNGMCPIDHTKISPVVKNIAVSDQVGELLIHCQYGCCVKPGHTDQYQVNPEGCPSIIKINERQQHESVCDYCPVACPNSSLCGTMLRKDSLAHLDVCQYTECPHVKHGCQYQGSKEAIATHLKSCKFEGVKGYLSKLDDNVKKLQDLIEVKDKTIDDLGKIISDLQERLDKSEQNGLVVTRRLDHLEDKQSKMVLETSSNFQYFRNTLKHIEQRLGLNSIEPQHLFKCNGTFVGHKGPVWSLCSSGDLLFSSSSDNTIKVWNISATYEGPRTLTGHEDIVLALATKDNYLYSGSSDKTIKLWNIKTIQLEHSFIAHDDPVCTLTCSSSYLFSGSLRSIKVWDLSGRTLIKALPNQNHWVRALIASDQFLYSGSYQSVKIWSLEKLEVVNVLQCTGGSVYCLTLSNKHIICGTYENMVHVWDNKTLTQVGSLSGHVGTIYDLAVLPTTGYVRLFSASYDKTIRVWNMNLMTCAQTLYRHEGSVTCLTTNRGQIFSGAVDSTIKAWY